jgi:hypothetical protein
MSTMFNQLTFLKIMVLTIGTYCSIVNASNLYYHASHDHAADTFGNSVAVFEKTMIIGAPKNQIDEIPSGAVYVFEPDGAEWQESTRLTADDMNAGDEFGTSVAINVDWIVIGAPGHEKQGAVYLFARHNGWQQTKLIADDAEMGEQFGRAVAILGDTLVIGAPGDNHELEDEDETGENREVENSGSVYVFVQNGTEWQQTQKLTASYEDAEPDAQFGSAIALNDHTLVVGMPNDDELAENAGAIYMFARDRERWQEQGSKLTATTTHARANEQFGHSISMTDNTLVVGTHLEASDDFMGAAYVFAFERLIGWVEEPTQLQSEPTSFGNSVAISHDTIIVGAPKDNEIGNETGAAFVFVRNEVNEWEETDKLVVSQANSNEQIGESVAINGNMKVLGSNSPDYGSISVFPTTISAFPPAGGHNTFQSVELYCGEECTIYYTRDGTEPSISSTRYNENRQISINKTTTLKYFSVGAAGRTSVNTEEYIIDRRNPVLGKISTVPTLQREADFAFRTDFETISFIASDTGGSEVNRIELQILCYDDLIPTDESCKEQPKYFNPIANKFTQTEQTVTVKDWESVDNDEIHWVFDVSQIPFLSPHSYEVVAIAYDLAGNPSEEQSIQFNFDTRDITALSLDLDKSTMLPQNSLVIRAKLTRYSMGGLEDKWLQLTITAPNGNEITSEPESKAPYRIRTNYEGVSDFYFATDSEESSSNNTSEEEINQFTANIFNQRGTYTFQVSFAEQSNLLAAKSESKSLLVGDSAGYAVLIQGKLENEEGIKAHNKTLNRVYRHLRERGFEKDNIFYFNYNTEQDVDLDGETGDIYVVPNKTDIKNVITKKLSEKLNNAPAPIYIIMVDHGSKESFYINNDVITPPNLNSWLTNLEKQLDVPEQSPRIVIIGACYSGSFIPKLSKTGRVIITSSAEDEVSYKGLREKNGIRSGEFFIDSLFHNLVDGQSITTSFNAATEETEVFTRRGDQIYSRFHDNAVQHPLLDDNGDRQGHNALLSGANGIWLGDGQEASNLYLGIGKKFDANSAENPAYIIEVTPTQYLVPDENTATLFLTTNESKADLATVEIRYPSITLHQDESSRVQLDFDELKRKFLNGVPGTEPKRFERELSIFRAPGRYDIFYTLRDQDTKDLAPIRHSLVYKNNQNNRAPKSFRLLSPEDGAETRTVLIFDWENSDDPHGISYNFFIATDEKFHEIVYQQEGLVASTTYMDDSVGLEDFGGYSPTRYYYWKVEAVDDLGARTESEIRKFTTNNPSEGPGIYSAIVCDALFPFPKCVPVPGAEFNDTLSGQPLTNKPGTSGSDQPLGRYNFLLDPEPMEYEFIVNAPTYVSTTLRRSVPSGQKVEQRIDLEPQNPRVCDYQYLELCTNQISCTNQGGYWWGDKCDHAPPPECGPESLTHCFYESTCFEAGGHWDHNAKICFPERIGAKQAGILQFSSSFYDVLENGGNATITITRTSGNQGAISVKYSTHEGTAIAGKDYENSYDTLKWVDGDSNPKSFQVKIKDEVDFGKNKTLTLSLSEPQGGAILGAPQQATLLIYENDLPHGERPGILQFEQPQYEFNENIGVATVLVTRTKGSDGDVLVNCSVSNEGAAQPFVDYIPLSGILAWGNGDTVPKQCQVFIIDDSIAKEGAETFKLTLSNPWGGATLGPQQQAIVTIKDFEPVSDQNCIESPEGSVNLGVYFIPGGADTKSFVRVTNVTDNSVIVKGTLYHESGLILGSRNVELLEIGAQATKVLSLSKLETQVGTAPWEGVAWLDITEPDRGLVIMNLLRNPNTTLTNMSLATEQALYNLPGGANANDELFVLAINTTCQSLQVKGTLYNPTNGAALGEPDVVLCENLKAKGICILTAELLENRVGLAAPWIDKRAWLQVTAPVSEIKLMGLVLNRRNMTMTNLTQVADNALFNLPSTTNPVGDRAFVRFTNITAQTVTVKGTLYHQHGQVLGSENSILLKNLKPNTTQVLSMGKMEKALKIPPWDKRARLVITEPATGLKIMGLIRTEKTGTLTNASATADHAVYNLPSTSNFDKAFVRITNLTHKTIQVKGTVYHMDGRILGPEDVVLVDKLPANSTIGINMKTLQNLLGVAPWDKRARLVITSPKTGIKLMDMIRAPSNTLTNVSGTLGN